MLWDDWYLLQSRCFALLRLLGLVGWTKRRRRGRRWLVVEKLEVFLDVEIVWLKLLRHLPTYFRMICTPIAKVLDTFLD